MRMINAEDFFSTFRELDTVPYNTFPTAKIVECKNCMHRKRIKGFSNRYCVILGMIVDLKDYCSWGQTEEK